MPTNKPTKDDKLLLVFDALVLSEMLGHEVGLGKIIHSDDHTRIRIKTSALASEARKQLAKIEALLHSSAPPDLVLNRHCAECEFRDRCRPKALEKDDLSLLSGIGNKERRKFNSKGIFTITQLSCTFRPRRRPKRLRDKQEKYHHSLKALAIREKKIHIVGKPELKIDGTPVYLDVEGLPDNDFYYLIGARVGNEDHHFWADDMKAEAAIWREFLGLLARVEKPVVIHYGSYETTFLRRMCERYGGPPEGSEVSEAIKSSINLLSIIYAQIYFPTFSNGLKDIARYLRFEWTDEAASGLQSIVWRREWEYLSDKSAKDKLLAYNAQDCRALNLVTDTVARLIAQTAAREPNKKNGGVNVVHVDYDLFQKKAKWSKFTSPLPSLEQINSASHWDYQRDRIYARSGKAPKKRRRPRPRLRCGNSQRPDMVVLWPAKRQCPRCNRRVRLQGPQYSRTVHDIIFGRDSLKRRLVKYVFQTYRCWKCQVCFGLEDRFKFSRRYGWNLLAYYVYQVIGLNIPQRTVGKHFHRLFGFIFQSNYQNKLKSFAAEYYAETKQKIIERIIQGELVHADETRANIRGKSAFVWVLTNMHEVVYILADSREGETIQKLLSGFKGVLVSDFYSAYDNIGCFHQRCLIHLMRDLNDEMMSNPFDEELKRLVTDFGDLLKAMVETVDRYGLKKYFLKKHLPYADRFYADLEGTDYQSEAALKCKDRFIKNKERLFTFLKFDGIPWNNNNAEHAIKAFARIRESIEGLSTERGTNEYLTLLSIAQTCECSGLDFLDFLRSGEKDIAVFAESNRRGEQPWKSTRHNRDVAERKKGGIQHRFERKKGAGSPKQISWADFQKKYFATIQDKQANTTAVRVRVVFKHLTRIFPTIKDLTNVTPEAMGRYKRIRIEENATPSTVYREISVIRVAIKKARKWNYKTHDLSEA